MTRLHFLLLSFASAVAGLLGLPVDREKRARRCNCDICLSHPKPRIKLLDTRFSNLAIKLPE